MKRVIPRLFLIVLLSAVLFAGTALGDIEGRYEVIGKVPAKHSLDVVRLDEYLNFTCPHCNNFRHAAKPLLAKYGKRLHHEVIPVLFRGQSDDALRLFFIGRKAGREDEVLSLIFNATFRYGVNINDPTVVSYLARSVGLGDMYQKQAQEDWVTKEIQDAQFRTQAAGIEATPTVVLEGALRVTPELGMEAYINNLDHLIAQLLKEQR